MMKHEGSFIDLLRGAKDVDPTSEIVEILKIFGEELKDYAFGIIGDVDRKELGILYKFLSEVGDRRIVPFLIKEIEDSTDLLPDAIESIGKVGTREAIKPLLEQLRAERTDYTNFVIESLCLIARRCSVEDMGEEIKKMGELDPITMANICMLFGVLTDRRYIHHLELYSKSEHSIVRSEAVSAMAKIDIDACLDHLIYLTSDDDGGVRLRAVRALGMGKGGRVVKALLSALDDENLSVRTASIQSLKRIAEKYPDSFSGQMESIVSLISRDGYPPVVMGALDILFLIGYGRMVSVIDEAILHSEPEVIVEAMRCTKRLEKSEVLRIAKPMLSHPHWLVRDSAVRALARFSDEKIKALLNERANVEKDKTVLKSIRKAI
jgi:HEAT repeat protein